MRTHNIIYVAGGKHMYSDKTNEQLIELLEERDETIEEKTQEIESKADEYNVIFNELHELHSETMDKIELEEFTKSVFMAGYEAGRSGKTGATPLKCWLNYKMMERM